MSPLLHYPTPVKGNEALTAIRGLSAFLPDSMHDEVRWQRVGHLSASSLLNFIEMRACSAYQKMAEYPRSKLDLSTKVVLNQLCEGYYYRLDEALPSLRELNRARTHRVLADRLLPYDPYALKPPLLGTEQVNPEKQVRLLAPYVGIAADVSAAGMDLLHEIAKPLDAAFASLNPDIFNNLSRGMEHDIMRAHQASGMITDFVEQKVVPITWQPPSECKPKPHSLFAEVVPFLGLMAAIGTSLPHVPPLLFLNIHDNCGLDAITSKALRARRIEYLGQIIRMTEDELLIPGTFGRGMLKKVRDLADKLGFELGMDIPISSEQFDREAKRREGFGKRDLSEFSALELPRELFKPIDSLEWSTHSSNVFKEMGIRWIGELVVLTEDDLMLNRRFGRGRLRETKMVLAEVGLGLGIPVPYTRETFQDVMERYREALGPEQFSIPSDEMIAGLPEVLFKSVDMLGVKKYVKNALKAFGIKYIGQFVLFSDCDLGDIKGCGYAARSSLRRAREKLLLRLKGWDEDIPNWSWNYRLGTPLFSDVYTLDTFDAVRERYLELKQS